MAINLFNTDTAGSIAFYETEFSNTYSSAPVFTSSDTLSVVQGAELTHTVTTTDADGDTVTYSLVNNSISWVSLVGSTLTLTPDLNVSTGSYIVTVRANDGVFDVDQTVTVTVTQAANLIVAPIKRVVEWDEGQTPDLILGDTFIHTCTLKAGVNSSPFDVSLASAICTVVVKVNHSKKLSDLVILSSTGLGADWSAGVVSIELPENVTAAIDVNKEQLAKIEIEVKLLGNTFTWFAPVNLIPGYVD